MENVQKLSNLAIHGELKTLHERVPALKGTDEVISKLQKYIKPVVFWKNIELYGEYEIHSDYVSEGLKECHKGTLLAATIGKELPDYSKKAYEEGKLWESTIADTLGSYAVEEVVEKFYKYLLHSNLSKGLYPSKRFSPGYGDWDLLDQIKIISILETEPEMKVHSSGILEPVKSITAIVGWASSPCQQEYPVGKKEKGLCEGKNSCAHCRTWACKKI